MKDYVLGNMPKEIKRLRLQASLFEPMTKDALQKARIKTGMRCIDVGCGSGDVTTMMADLVGKKGKVVGVDIDQKYLNYCKSINRHCNVEFIHDNILESDLDSEGYFDIVFSRFMFVHLHDKIKALKSMIRLAKKPGVIIIQELDHAPGSWLSYPKRDSVETLRKIYFTLVKESGGDPLAGRKLYKMFVDQSLKAKVECYSPCVVMGNSPYSILGWKIAESLRPRILSKKLLTKTEYTKLYKDLRDLAKDPESFVTYARFFSIIGRKSRL